MRLLIKRLQALAFLLAIFACHNARSTVHTITDGMYGYTADTNSITFDGIGDFVNINNARGVIWSGHLKNFEEGIVVRPLFKMDLSALNGFSSNQIVNAKLRMFLDYETNLDNGQDLQIHHNGLAGSEDFLASDFHNAAYVDTGLRLLVSESTRDTYFEFDVTQLIQENRENNGTYAAFRLQVTDDISAFNQPGAREEDQFFRFHYAGNADVQSRPQLIVTTIPEPAAMGLIAVFSVFSLTAKRLFQREGSSPR